MKYSRYIGLDGEGLGRKNHRYILLGAASSDYVPNQSGTAWYVENLNGLSSEQCLDFLINLPADGLKMGFSLNYDWTKILEDLPTELIYLLFRPELRKRKNDKLGPRPVHWNKYGFNYQGSRMRIWRGDRKIELWDVFKFFQSRFVTALETWKVGYPELWQRMQSMKEKRGFFRASEQDAIRSYCLEECACLGSLTKTLLEAHRACKLELRSFHGAGSSGASMIKAIGVNFKKIKPAPDAMREAVAIAFAGGRFEHSRLGAILQRVESYDIASAYPYQTYQLPCLEHARWELTRRRADLAGARGALVRYRLNEPTSALEWGPFPFRERDGSISYPEKSGGGWVWLSEYLQGESLFSNVEFVKAWILKSDCNCHPFKPIAQYYLDRCRLGKEGRGLVLKLGCNSVYGKLAQSKGSAPYNNWIWAGMITSGTRTQLLQLMGLVSLENCIQTATDGLGSLVPCSNLPVPIDTGTFGAVGPKGEPKPALGSWEHKTYERGLFLARPGIYFPNNPEADERDRVRARGVGRSILFDQYAKIVEAYNSGRGFIKFENLQRFGGAKTCTYRTRVGQEWLYHRSSMYGNWQTRPAWLSFDPMPKRLPGMRLRRFPEHLQSWPYDPATISKEAEALMQFGIELSEQPDFELEEE